MLESIELEFLLIALFGPGDQRIQKRESPANIAVASSNFLWLVKRPRR